MSASAKRAGEGGINQTIYQSSLRLDEEESFPSLAPPLPVKPAASHPGFRYHSFRTVPELVGSEEDLAFLFFYPSKVIEVCGNFICFGGQR